MRKRIQTACAVLVLAGGVLSAAQVSEIARGAMEAARSYGAAVRSCDLAWAMESMYPPIKRMYAEQYAVKNGDERVNSQVIMGISNETDTERAEHRRRMQQQGLEAMRAAYTKRGQELLKSGIRIESYSVGDPVAEYILHPYTGVARAARQDAKGDVSAEDLQGGNERSRLVVLPTKLVVSSPGKNGRTLRVQRTSYIFAIRDEVVRGKIDVKGHTVHDTKLNKWYFVDANTDISVLRTFFPDLPLRIPLPSTGDRIIN